MLSISVSLFVTTLTQKLLDIYIFVIFCNIYLLVLDFKLIKYCVQAGSSFTGFEYAYICIR